jgi:hypothetical protein
VCIRYRGKVSTEPLTSNDKGIIFTEPSRCLSSIVVFIEPLPGQTANLLITSGVLHFLDSFRELCSLSHALSRSNETSISLRLSVRAQLQCDDHDDVRLLKKVTFTKLEIQCEEKDFA